MLNNIPTVVFFLLMSMKTIEISSYLCCLVVLTEAADVKLTTSYLSDHPVPNSPDQLAVFAVGDQVQVVGELDVAGKFLQDVDAEAFAAEFGVWLCVTHNAER